jgi:N-acyl-D-amino-acid deacylase
MDYDIVILNGIIVDGTGNPWFRSDIGVEEGKIIDIGKLKSTHVDRVVDASGLIVCPGFIDIHSHSDFILITNPTMDAKIYQGVTTELNGNCGTSPTPFIGREIRKLGYYHATKLSKSWSTTKEYFRVLEEKGHATNTATLLGYVNVRVAVMGFSNLKPSYEELSVMKALVSQGMENGLFGLSTGLLYPPSSFATTEELIELCKVVNEYNGVYVTHIRSESKFLVEAIEEAIRIGKESGVNVQCVHHKAFGKPHWDKIPITLSLIKKARENEVDVTLDVYPYIRDSGNFTGWLPTWAHAGGPEKLLKRLRNPETRDKLKKDIENNVEEGRSVLSTSVLTTLSKHSELSGKRIAELAKNKNMDVIDYTIDLLIEEEGLGVGISSQFGSEENVKRILRHPASMIGSDGSGVSSNTKEWIHPRSFGTYPRFINKYVREEKVLPLQEAIRKCTSFPAQRLGLKDRGMIREGMWADITIFNYDTICDNFSLTNPNQYAEGVEYVLVNGTLVLDKGRHTGNLPGKVLRRGMS